MAKQKPIEDAIPDLEQHLQESFNALIKVIHQRLSTADTSPVYTGFFASSWKVASQPIQPKDFVEANAPWSDYKKFNDEAVAKGLSERQSEISPRFPVKKEYSYKRRVFIGNSTEYALYALENPIVANFVQGPELGTLVKEMFSEKAGKAPRISVAFRDIEFDKKGRATGRGNYSPYAQGLGFFGSQAGEEFIDYKEL
jgi:hypothetical protein|tara:strand:- start:446 stop:1039 length:594 start_codon:yes stop_codon:yes gene_type:complete